jgi:hypothetical protein
MGSGASFYLSAMRQLHAEHAVTGFANNTGNSVSGDAVKIGVPATGAAIVGGIVAASIDTAGVAAAVAGFCRRR